MATLQELYRLKDNPDLTHWRTVKLFTLAEASLLTVGIDPLEYSHLSDYPLRDELTTKRPINWQHALLLMRSLSEAICTHEVKSPFINLEKSDYQNTWDFVEEQAKISIDNAHEIILTATKIHRDELFKWLKKNNYFESIQSTPANIDTHVVETSHPQPITHNEILLLPEPTYTTPALEVIKAVVNHWWKDFDLDSEQPHLVPQQKHVKAWIGEHYPEMDSDYIRTAIDKICRHPIAKNGGNRKTNV